MMPGSVHEVTNRKSSMSVTITKNIIGSAGVTSALEPTTKIEKGMTMASTQIWMYIMPPISREGPERQQPQRKRLFPGHISWSLTIAIIILCHFMSRGDLRANPEQGGISRGGFILLTIYANPRSDLYIKAERSAFRWRSVIWKRAIFGMIPPLPKIGNDPL